jgi:hypothetical protein
MFFFLFLFFWLEILLFWVWRRREILNQIRNFFYRDFGRSSQGPIFFSGDFFSGAGVGGVNRRGVREDSLRDILFKNRAIDY